VEFNNLLNSVLYHLCNIIFLCMSRCWIGRN